VISLVVLKEDTIVQSCKFYIIHFVNCIGSVCFVRERWQEMQMRHRFFFLLEATSTAETYFWCPSTVFSVCLNTQYAMIIGQHWRYWPLCTNSDWCRGQHWKLFSL